MAAAISATWVLAARRPLVCSLSSSTRPNTRKLVLYSKPGCCLCDGLKEKLNAAFSLSSGSDSLHDVVLQVRGITVIPKMVLSRKQCEIRNGFEIYVIPKMVRDITMNPEWEKAYQYEIPVLAKENSDGKEEILPRLSPRLSVEIIQKKLLAAFS